MRQKEGAGQRKRNNDNNGENKNQQTETFTIVWKNDDGTVLKTDANVAKGTLPLADWDNTYGYYADIEGGVYLVENYLKYDDFTYDEKSKTYKGTVKIYDGDRNVVFVTEHV